MTDSRRRLSFSIACAGLAGIAGLASAPVLAQEVVQPLPDAASAQLSDALQRLSRNPDSLPALVDAGMASLAIGDVDAALRFYSRAQAMDPQDGRVLAGLAVVALRRGDAVTALALFDNAAAAGHPMASLAAERGLAFDLIGNNAGAQQLYREALSRQESDEVLRRLALSYAIAGDPEASEATLLPLLQRQDRSAYRTRAFALAIMGRETEAVTIAEAMLPPSLSQRLTPYLSYMRYLTRAQQAAAANLGRFPTPSEVGRDTPQIAALGDATAGPGSNPASDERLIPGGAPLGPAPSPAATPAPAPAPIEVPPAVEPQPAGPPEAPIVVATLEEQAPLSVPLADVAVVAPAQEEVIDLAAAFADFTMPQGAVVVRTNPDAVDITAIEPPREVPAPPPPPPPPPPAHPSRHWVQVATGQDVSAFRFDWRRIARNASGLLDEREAFTARWGQSNRLLTGPFANAEQAQQFVSELAAAGVDAFRFTSTAGEEVRALD